MKSSVLSKVKFDSLKTPFRGRFDRSSHEAKTQEQQQQLQAEQQRDGMEAGEEVVGRMIGWGSQPPRW